MRAARKENAEADDTLNAMRAAGATNAQLREMGFSDAQLLASAPVGFDDGVGCEADPAQGRHWLEQAALQGVNAAKARLEALAL